MTIKKKRNIDRNNLVLATKTMRFSEKESIEYLKSNHYEISVPTYYRILKKVSEDTRSRLYDTAKNFEEKHLQRIDSLEQIEKFLWQNVIKENDNAIKQTIILKEIKELQPYLSAYHETSKDVLENVVEEIEKENISVS